MMKRNYIIAAVVTALVMGILILPRSGNASSSPDIKVLIQQLRARVTELQA